MFLNESKSNYSTETAPNSNNILNNMINSISNTSNYKNINFASSDIITSYFEAPFDGQSASDIFQSTYGYTYDDIILLPGYIDFSTDAVNLRTKCSRNIPLKIPFVSSPMDTVTEHQMAIGLALQGGIGIIHYNMSIQEQAHAVLLYFSNNMHLHLY